MKRVLTVLLAMLFCLPTVACKKESDREVDETKTQFYIGNYDGGVGRTWIETLGAKFEEEYAETEFEPGKKGVQIWYTHNKDEYKSGTLLTTIQNQQQDIYFLDSIVYSDFVSQGRLLDITDAVTEPNQLDGGVSIESKMEETRRDLYKWSDGKYYAVPFMDHVLGIVYDVDLFEEENLYNSGLGPNGKTGVIDGVDYSYDDGLPRTWDEFKQLMNTMKQKGITPFTWCGSDAGYRTDLLNEIWAKYEGVDNYALNSTFDGEYTFEGDSAPTQITINNGYLLQGQTGKKVALTAVKDILSDSANYSRAGFYASQKHTEAQDEYLLSVRRPNGTNQIAMLIEGSWWENEARGTFDDMEVYGKKYGYGQRRFGLMPLPNFAGGSTDNVVYMGRGTSAVVVNAKTTKPALSKQFLQYVHTNESLAFFNEHTGVTRPYTYTMTQEQKNNMTYFGRSLRDFLDGAAQRVYYQLPTAVRTGKSAYFNDWGWKATVSGAQIYSDPFLAFYDNKNLTVDEYCQGLKNTFSRENWERELADYLN